MRNKRTIDLAADEKCEVTNLFGIIYVSHFQHAISGIKLANENLLIIFSFEI